MTTLVLRLAGPMQSWGVKGRFTRRTTQMEPTKSGVVGLLAAALGHRRTDPVEELAGLRMGVRVEQQGTLLQDFQTASRGRVTAPLSYRYYMSDAVFLVAVEGPEPLVSGLADAMRSPVFPLYLGRRAFPLTGMPVEGVREDTVEDVLARHPWRASPGVMRQHQSATVRLRIVRDVGPSDEVTAAVTDVPVSFDPNRRTFGTRMVTELWVDIENPHAPDGMAANNADAPVPGVAGTGACAATFTNHDPFGFLGGS